MTRVEHERISASLVLARRAIEASIRQQPYDLAGHVKHVTARNVVHHGARTMLRIPQKVL